MIKTSLFIDEQKNQQEFGESDSFLFSIAVGPPPSYDSMFGKIKSTVTRQRKSNVILNSKGQRERQTERER